MSFKLLNLIVLLYAAHVAEVSPILIVQGKVIPPLGLADAAANFSPVKA
jgi:hypothetical protein